MNDPEQSTTNVKTRRGRVVSDKMDKTIVVEVGRVREHPLYEKYLNRHSRLKAHDEAEEAKEGDLVEIRETRPISKTKRWRLIRVLESATTPVTEIEVPTEEPLEGEEEP